MTMVLAVVKRPMDKYSDSSPVQSTFGITSWFPLMFALIWTIFPLLNHHFSWSVRETLGVFQFHGSVYKNDWSPRTIFMLGHNDHPSLAFASCSNASTPEWIRGQKSGRRQLLWMIFKHVSSANASFRRPPSMIYALTLLITWQTPKSPTTNACHNLIGFGLS